MTLFSRRPKYILRAFTATPRLAEVLPPQPAGESLPQWWKSLPASIPVPGRSRSASQIPSIKHCYALQEIFRHAICLPLWHDVSIAVETDGSVVSDGLSGHIKKAGGPHPRGQFLNAFDNHAQHYKFHSPWLFVCEAPVAFAWMHPTYHQKDVFRFHTMEGIVEYRNQHNTNVNVLLRHTPGERTEFEFAAGEILAYLIPLTEAAVEVKAEELSRAEFERLDYARNITLHQLLFNRRRKIRPAID